MFFFLWQRQICGIAKFKFKATYASPELISNLECHFPPEMEVQFNMHFVTNVE